jgi:hypothetical protein
MTAQEYYDYTSQKAKAWQSDVFLTMMGTTVPHDMNEEGKTANWTATYYSPSKKSGITYTFSSMAGKEFTNEVPGMTWYQPVPGEISSSMLDSKKIYDTAIKEAGDTFNKDTDSVGIQLMPIGGKWFWNINCHEKENLVNVKLNKRMSADSL